MTLSTPGPTLGVIGGGQLGRMLAEAAAPLGVDVVVADPTPDAPAASVARDQLVGAFDDEETFRALAERSEFLTFEIELADPSVLETVAEATGTPVHPRPETLALIEDKLVQKERMEAAGIPVPAFRRVDTVEDLRTALQEIGYPAMLKARMGGYDGRGNVPIYSPDDVDTAFEAIDGDAMVESFVDFERELSVIGAVGVDEVDTYPLTETIHEAEILRETVAPARTRGEISDAAHQVARDVLAELEGRGVYGIELFETTDGGVLLNEIAPRPHNSGHWTIEGALTSQFEQHVRAVTGRPLGATDIRSTTVTANVLGDVDEPQQATLHGVDEVLAADGISLHWYGKTEVRPLRKMGHITAVGDGGINPDLLLRRTRRYRNQLTFQSE